MFPIIHRFERPPTKLINAFREIPTSILSDVMGRRGAMSYELEPIIPTMKLVGPAFTIKTYASDNLMCHLALVLAQPGDILVVDAGGYRNAALWGELMSLNAQLRGLGGLVIDGAVRDRLALEKLDFPIFACCCVPAGTFKMSIGELNMPVSCGGVSVTPGDLVVGDADGVVVVPRDRLEEVLQRAKNQLESEQILRAQIASGKNLFDLLGLDARIQIQGLDWE